MADGVVDQVADEALDQDPVARGQGRLRVGIDAQVPACYLRRSRVERILGRGGEVDGGADSRRNLGGGEREQRLDRRRCLVD